MEGMEGVVEEVEGMIVEGVVVERGERGGVVVERGERGGVGSSESGREGEGSGAVEVEGMELEEVEGMVDVTKPVLGMAR